MLVHCHRQEADNALITTVFGLELGNEAGFGIELDPSKTTRMDVVKLLA